MLHPSTCSFVWSLQDDLGLKVSPCAGMWYYLSLFYCDKDLGMAYSWVSVGTAFSQVTPCLAAQQALLPVLLEQECMRDMEHQAASFAATSPCHHPGATCTAGTCIRWTERRGSCRSLGRPWQPACCHWMACGA